MSVPPEAANDALNVTLVVVQSLMKRCIKVKEGDPEGLKLSDEIARRVVSVSDVLLEMLFVELTFDTGKRLETLRRNSNIILSPATLLRRRYPAILKGRRLSECPRLDLCYCSRPTNQGSPAIPEDRGLSPTLCA